MREKQRILIVAFTFMGLSALVIAADQKALVARAAGEPGWGPAVDGVQCRLLANKDKWQATETPKSKAYVRDPKGRKLQLVNAPHLRCQLEIDGLWHRWSGPQWSGMLAGYYPSDWIAGRGGYMVISLDESCWKNVQNNKPLDLSPGKHTVRFGWAEHEREKPVRLMSNPVEIEILPSPGGIKQMSDREKRRRQVVELFHHFTRAEQLTEADKEAGLRYDLASGLQPKFAWSDIPVLLEQAESRREMRSTPRLSTSSHIGGPCFEGMAALWLVEGLRREHTRLMDRRQTGEASGSSIAATHVGYFRLPLNAICYKGEEQNSEDSPQLHDEVLNAYKEWWRMVGSLPPEQAALFNPLDLTDVSWGLDHRVRPLQVYDNVMPTGTVAQRTIKAARYAGDHYELGPVLQTIYYRLKDQSRQPPFSKEMLTVQKLTLHFYDGNGREIRKEDYFPAPKADVGTATEGKAVQYGNDRAKRVRDLFNSYVRGEEIDEAYLTQRIPAVPKFYWADIPILLELAQSEKDAKRIPHCLESSYHQQRCREGMIALWLVQGLRRKQVASVRQSQTGDENRPRDHYHLTLNPICWKDQRNTDGSPQLHRELLGAFRRWWRKFGVLPAEQAALFDPLDLTDLKFGGEPHGILEPLEIYEKITPDGTIARRVLRECLYPPQGPQPGRKLRTIYYSPKDPSAPPPFTRETLTVQKVVLFFYDDNDNIGRAKSVYPASEQP